MPALPTDLDVVVHCAGDVSFDPPIQSAFQTNVVGVQGLVERVVESAAQPDGSHRPLHYVHVSTAYVGGRRRGPVMEVSVEHTVDWRAEHEAAQRVAARIEDTSRTPAVLSRLLAKAEKAHDRAGPLAVAADAEERRRTWVTDQQKAAGGERARSLGWTDVYTFTKALGERVVEEVAAPVLPTTVYRPSIIESALTTPHPGWIEGFKMADPIILAYGRGELPELPAAPDSVIDIVPIDLVVNSIIAVAATPPPVGEPALLPPELGLAQPAARSASCTTTCASTSREHPFDMDSRGAVRLATWRFPGARIVERALTTGEKAYGVAEGALSLAPRSDRVRSIARNLDTQKRRLDFLRRYMDLYRAYTQVELYFVDDTMLALHRSMDPEDQETFGFDTAVIDWEHYLIEVHCPAITQGVRDYDVIRRKRNRSGGPAPRVIAPRDPSEPVDPDASPVLAVFDMDGTLLSSNIIETYLWVRLPELSAAGKVRELASTAARLPLYLRAERRDRGALIRSAYRRYEGADLRALEEMVDETLTPHVLERVSGAARAPGPRAPRGRAPDGPHHRRGHADHPPAGAAVRRDRRGRARHRLPRPVHGLPHPPAAGRRGARGLAQAVRLGGGGGPVAGLRLRRLPLRPADAPGRRPPDRGEPGRHAVPGGPQVPLADRGLGHRRPQPAPAAAEHRHLAGAAAG